MSKILEQTTNPGAWIVNSYDNGRKSIKKNGIVYLEDNVEFALELFNPLKKTVLALIKLNGECVNSYIALKPGKRIYLDCNPDTGKKFVFKQYTVENSPEAKAAISDNGKVEVLFYSTINVNDVNYTIWQPNQFILYNTYPIFATNTGSIIPSTNIITDDNSTYTYTNGSIFTSSNNTSINIHNCNSSNIYYTTDNIVDEKDNNDLKTGRVENGSKSNTTFSRITDIKPFLIIKTVSYTILPAVKNISSPFVKKDKKNLDNLNYIKNFLFENNYITKDLLELSKSFELFDVITLLIKKIKILETENKTVKNKIKALKELI